MSSEDPSKSIEEDAAAAGPLSPSRMESHSADTYWKQDTIDSELPNKKKFRKKKSMAEESVSGKSEGKLKKKMRKTSKALSVVSVQTLFDEQDSEMLEKANENYCYVPQTEQDKVFAMKTDFIHQQAAKFVRSKNFGVENAADENLGGETAGESFDKEEEVETETEKVDGSCSKCCKKFIAFLRSLWATRLTEKVDANKTLYIQTTIRELLVYIIFLVVLMILAFGMTTSTMYYFTIGMTELFVNSKFPDGAGSFESISSARDTWTFLQHPFMDGLFWDTWYNQNTNLSEAERNFIFFENKLLGVPRLRQVKVKNGSCQVASVLRQKIAGCYAMYDSTYEETNPSVYYNGTAWRYTKLSSSYFTNYDGVLGTYGQGGYIQDLARNKEESVKQIKMLFDRLWIDRGTRAIFIDFTIYNANINLFCVIKLIIEFPATGGAITSHEFRTVKLLRYVSTWDYFVMANEFLFVLFIVYYTIEEILEIKHTRLSYFKDIWNWLDIVLILISALSIVFNFYRNSVVNDQLDDLLRDQDRYANFDFISYWQQHFNQAVAIAVFLAMIKIFKYISFNKTMTQLTATLSTCAKDLIGFAVMFFIVFFAFAQFGYLVFGTQVNDFRRFQHAVFTLFRIILGDFNFDEMEKSSPILGPIFFILYVFFVFFILINMFLAIINDTYSIVKERLANEKNEFEMVDYFKDRANKIINKLRKDKIVRIQEVLHNAELTKQEQLSFDEWRVELKSHGYADVEIEALFVKYDEDGDRRLDYKERSVMFEDLENQKLKSLANHEDSGNESDEGTAKRCLNNDGKDGAKDEDEEANARNLKIDEDDDDEDNHQEVTVEMYEQLDQRVDVIEQGIFDIVMRLEDILTRLARMETSKLEHRKRIMQGLEKLQETNLDEASSSKV